jgi:hypothetical protein
LASPDDLRRYRDLVTQPAITAGHRRDEHDGMGQREVPRACDDHRGVAPGLFRADDRIEINEPDIARS